MAISIITAMDKQRLIGQGNTLPWHLPADLAYFKKKTIGKIIVMGRKTYQSIGYALPDRDNIVISDNKNLRLKDADVVSNLDDIINLAKNKEVIIIGGATLYQQFLPLCKRLYITRIDAILQGDTYFPKFSEQQWQLTERIKKYADEKNPYDYCFEVWERLS